MNRATSGWQLVISGVPRFLVLGSFLFIVFIHDLVAGVEHILSKSIDNIKPEGAVDYLEG